MIQGVLHVGDKVEIRIQMEVAQENKTGTKARVFQSQILDYKDNGDLELAMPINSGKLVLLPLELRYEFIFIDRNYSMHKAEGSILERYKSQNRFMILVRLRSTPERFQRRQFFRLTCTMDVFFWKITEEQSRLGTAEKILADLVSKDQAKYEISAKTVDISGGGARFVTTEEMEENQYLLMCIHLKSEERDEQIMIPGRVLAAEKMGTALVTWRCRISFVNSNKKISESIVQFVFAEERKHRKSGK